MLTGAVAWWVSFPFWRNPWHAFPTLNLPGNGDSDSIDLSTPISLSQSSAKAKDAQQAPSITGDQKIGDRASPGDPAFIPVQLDAGELLCNARGGFEIDLHGGATVKVPPGATTAERRELIADIVQATSDEVTL